jgi:four helix bundle protein
VESFQARGFRIALRSLAVYRKLVASADLPRHASVQLCRAATAIGANLEEAKSAYSRRDLAAKYAIALREARECTFWLKLIGTDQPSLRPLFVDIADDCEQMVSAVTAAV